jgi:hypothetical protein
MVQLPGKEPRIIAQVMRGVLPEPSEEVATERPVKAANHHGGFGTRDSAVRKHRYTPGTLLEHRSGAAATEGV